MALVHPSMLSGSRPLLLLTRARKTFERKPEQPDVRSEPNPFDVCDVFYDLLLLLAKNFSSKACERKDRFMCCGGWDAWPG